MSRPSPVCLIATACLAGCHEPATQAPDAAVAPDGSMAIDAAPATCGTRTGQRGKTNRTIRAAGLDRTYIVYLPPDVDPQTPVPLVFVHHGYTMSAEAMYQITSYAALADAEHIAVAFPDGQAGPDSLGAPWNVGSDVCRAGNGATPPSAPGDDFAMLDAIEADISLDQCLDTSHVFVTGFSMGGYFSHHAGCMRDDIRAVAPHSGGTHALSSCAAGHKPIIIFHGTADAVVPNGCDDPAAIQPLGATASATAWAMKNGCATTTTSHAVQGGTCRYYDDCPPDGQVALCTFTNMGHCWAGGTSQSIYACPAYADATALEWSFFKQYAW